MARLIQFTVVRFFMSLFTLLTVSLMERVHGNCAERYLVFKNTQGQQISIDDIQAEERRLGLKAKLPLRGFQIE